MEALTLSPQASELGRAATPDYGGGSVSFELLESITYH